MAARAWVEIPWSDLLSDVVFHTPGPEQGQIVRVAYAYARPRRDEPTARDAHYKRIQDDSLPQHDPGHRRYYRREH